VKGSHREAASTGKRNLGGIFQVSNKKEGVGIVDLGKNASEVWAGRICSSAVSIHLLTSAKEEDKLKRARGHRKQQETKAQNPCQELKTGAGGKGWMFSKTEKGGRVANQWGLGPPYSAERGGAGS